ncbi:MAG: DUF3619 family protein [Candidatus Accumulibacter sp.]|jgi:hypothetical protein|nr:DUF3619 family protein [Accumulibacter sp.]
MNELHFAYKIRQHLNRGLREMRSDTAERLASARKAALARQKRPAAHPALAAAGALFTFRSPGHGLSQTVAALALLACAIGSACWIADRRVQELGDIDSAILSDELPLDAFTDKGFAAWLHRESPAE